MYVYIKSKHEELWTVGFYAPDGEWHPASDHTRETDAQWQVHFLNGGSAPDLLTVCEKIMVWLDRLAVQHEKAAENKTFPTLAEANAADAANFRKTAAHIRDVIAKATGSK